MRRNNFFCGNAEVSIKYCSYNLPYEKVGKNEPVCIADEVPFDIPERWEWVRLGSVCQIARGGSPRPIKQFLTNDEDGINWIKISDSDKGGKYISSTKEKIIPEGVSKSRMVHAGDFLLTNSMSFGRPYILNIDGCIHDGWLVLSDYSSCYEKDFLFYMLSSRFAYFQFCEVVSGAVVKNLNSEKVAAALFPLPPLEEQRRIVQAIEKIEPFIDEYTEMEEVLSGLTNSFPEQLKKSILQWAVQGKLVPQDPDDEPASVLLERIRAEKEQLIKAGKIKRDKQSWKSNSFAAACGVSDRVLWQTLKDRPYITKVCICLDNDEIGQKAAQRISKALADRNICNRILVPTRKDWNEDLSFLRKEGAK